MTTGNSRAVAAGAWCVVLTLALSAPASGQTAAAPAPAPIQSSSSSGEFQADVDAGADAITWVRNRGITNAYKKGWHAGVSYRLTGLISVIAEISGDYRTLPAYTANIHAYSGGVRFQSGAIGQGVRPFAQILMGGAQDNGTGTGKINHYPVVSPGGGADVAVSGCVAIRLRADFPLLMTFGDVFKGTRLSIGLSLSLGAR